MPSAHFQNTETTSMPIEATEMLSLENLAHIFFLGILIMSSNVFIGNRDISGHSLSTLKTVST